MPVSPPSNAKLMFEGKVMSFYQWEQAMFDGSSTTFECVTRPDSVGVLAFIDPKTVLITRQEQAGKDEAFLDLPGGRTDPGEGLEESARREFEEETGYRAGRFTEWYRIPRSGDYRYELGFYVATDLAHTGAMHLDAGEKIELLEVSWDELIQMCLKRQLRQPRIMLEILAMEFDPETKERLRNWLMP